jgi:hypothetical protein
MRRKILTFFTFFSFLASYPNATIESALNQLDSAIEVRDDYFKKKANQIGKIRDELQNVDKTQWAQYFKLNHLLFDEYSSFIYDSAFHYALEMQATARMAGDGQLKAIADLKISFVLFSSGMFHEALDTLNNINEKFLSRKHLVEYYDYKSRAYYDMAEYAGDPFFAPVYRNQGNHYTKLAIEFASPDSYQKWASKALLHLRQNNYDSSLFYYKKVINEFDLTLHQEAMMHASMAQNCLAIGDTTTAITYLSKSAINDIKSVVTETIALRNLAIVLYRLGYLKEAHRYIILANEDAKFYGARQRAFQISGVLPLIEGEKLGLTEKQKSQLEVYLIILALLALIVLLSLIIIFKQLTKLKKARQKIENANTSLSNLNESLRESNKIKEEYIAYYFNISTSYVDKLEQLKESIERNLDNKRYSIITQALSKVVIKKEREKLFQNFDKIFLSIFPDFVDKFNELFNEEDKVKLGDNNSMNTDLRIFALIRMGINENEKIAKILNFSINTIYSYKNRIKTRSFIPNNEFEDKIMEIKSV